MSGLTRRKFIAGAALSATGLAVSGGFTHAQAAELPGEPSTLPAADYNIMEEVLKYRKIDSHVHVNLGSTDTEVQKNMLSRLSIIRSG